MSRIITIIILICLTAEVSAQDYFRWKRTSFSTNNFNEFSPEYYNDEIVYCTDLNTQVFVSYTTPDNDNLIDIHTARYKGDLKFGISRVFAREITTNFNEGPMSFTADGKTMYFTRTIEADKTFGNSLRGDTAYGIFSAELVKDKWVNVQPFKYNRNSSNVGFPFITPDGSILFFCSDMPGGEGGLDIWMVEKTNRSWGRARNLGDAINTPGNEVSPFLHESGRLYFASDGFNGREDTDIYYSEQVNGEWTKPILMEGIFNSRGDDFGFIANARIDTGYFTSNRRENDDIYQFYSPYPPIADCGEQKENNHCYVFYEQGSMQLDTTSLKYEWDLGDGTKIRGLEAEHCFEPGNYLIQLNVIDTLTGEVFFNQATFDFEVEDAVQPYISAVDTTYVNREVNLSGSKSNVSAFTVENYYWEPEFLQRFEGETIQYLYSAPGTYTIKLLVTGEQGYPTQVQCVKRNIVVLPKQDE